MGKLKIPYSGYYALKEDNNLFITSFSEWENFFWDIYQVFFLLLFTYFRVKFFLNSILQFFVEVLQVLASHLPDDLVPLPKLESGPWSQTVTSLSPTEWTDLEEVALSAAGSQHTGVRVVLTE